MCIRDRVQKGNAPTERKIQRLFRRGEVSSLIKKCNDFGAGGVSVAIGELADGLRIDLDKVPKKYAGLDGTELAISESQERMAVVLDKKDVEQFLSYAAEENLEATVVAEVTEEKRLVMSWRGKEIVNLSRAFLDTNGAHQETTVEVEMPDEKECYYKKQAELKNVKAVSYTHLDVYKRQEKHRYICDLRARIECERISEHSTRSDRVTNIAVLLSLGASPLACTPQNPTNPYLIRSTI